VTSPETSAFLDQLSARLPGDDGSALNDLEKVGWTVLVALVALNKAGHETKPSAISLGADAMERVRRISILLPDKRAVASILERGAYRRSSRKRSRRRSTGPRNRREGYIA